MPMRCEFDALQVKSELDALIKIFKEENITSYLEIGSRCGGSLWPIMNALPQGSRCVAVDLGGGTKTVPDSKPFLRECIEALRKRGYHASVIFGDSTDGDVIEEVYKLAPYDAVFIDGNHTKQYVTADWINYGQIAKKLTAFHDISWYRATPKPTQYPIEVPAFWESLKRNLKEIKFVEIKHEPQDNGIGVLWR